MYFVLPYHQNHYIIERSAFTKPCHLQTNAEISLFNFIRLTTCSFDTDTRVPLLVLWIFIILRLF